MKQRKLAVCGVVCLASVLIIALPTRTQAKYLDKEGDITLGIRAYVNARVGTEATDRTVTNFQDTQTFPYSAAGHLRQNRYYTEIEFEHNLARLVKEGWGPLQLLNDLPFRIRGLKYHLTFRGEADLIYDWGPREYSTSAQYVTTSQAALTGQTVTLPQNPISGPTVPGSPTTCAFSPAAPGCHREVDVLAARRRLRHLGTDRERLFQAYLEGEVGDLFFRLGRQVWSWGETDGFRLLDQINPVDSSFGGFLVSLDERRVPLDMLRLEYRLGDFGPITEMSLQGYGAIDTRVGFAPGTPAGSPWTLPNLGKPSATTLTTIITPARTLGDMRGGARLYWNMFDATFSLAHYYTYVDTPAVEVQVVADENVDNPLLSQGSFPLKTFPDGYSAHLYQTAPLVQITGATTTFAIDSLYSVVRSEFAYFKDEPRFTQAGIDPFIYRYNPQFRHRVDANTITGGRDTGDSINFVLGWDINRYFRFLNPYQTFFISTQFFYKHLQDATKRSSTPPMGPGGVDLPVNNGTVLPVPARFLNFFSLGNVEPEYVHNPADQFLQTLFISTSYYSGQINPSFTLFYDWTGSLVYAPSITFQRDPWRFTVEYDILDAPSLTGASGTSLLRDRDNILFQLGYAI